jgi:hypothetical protein
MTFKIDTPQSPVKPVAAPMMSDAVFALAKGFEKGYDIKQDILRRRSGVSKFSYANLEHNAAPASQTSTPRASNANGGWGTPTE